ncbi:hypothetical protein HK405_009309 [Cladochytrium tenue]|nr:hypothetical protein HK405_009309 [Cladochytrium tenue]
MTATRTTTLTVRKRGRPKSGTRSKGTPRKRKLEAPLITAPTTDQLSNQLTVPAGTPSSSPTSIPTDRMTVSAALVNDDSEAEAIYNVSVTESEANTQWTLAQSKTLLATKQSVANLFNHKSNNQAKKRGWLIVTEAVNAEHDTTFTKEQVIGRFKRLCKKWKDWRPGSGVQAIKTGNCTIDAKHSPDDSELELLQQFFAKKLGHGGDLGQDQDMGLTSDDEHKESHHDNQKGAVDSGTRKLRQEQRDSMMAKSLELGFSAVGNGFTTLAAALSSNGGQDSMEQVVEAAIERQTKALGLILADGRAHTERVVEAAIERQTTALGEVLGSVLQKNIQDMGKLFAEAVSKHRG